MLNKIIKNETPYIGRIFLDFEKYPEYTGKSFLNKIHLDLGYTKLVSRIEPNRGKDGQPEVDPEKAKLIGKFTGGVIGDHYLDGRPDPDFILANSFLSKDGHFIGSIRDGWWYYKNNMIVSEKYPTRVAIKVKPSLFAVSKSQIKNYSDNFIEGFYGYTHRGGSLFKLGDRLFDSHYYPQKGDYDLQEWMGYVKNLEESLMKRVKGELCEDESISNWIPFNRRGKETITTWDQAEESAKRLSDYLS